MALDEFLATVPWLAAFDDAERARVSECMSECSWKAGETIASEGEDSTALYLIRSGSVGVHVRVGGVEQLYTTRSVGETHGLPALLDRGTHVSTARAAEDSEGLALGFERVDALCAAHPETGLKLLRAAGLALGQGIRTLVDQYRETLAWYLETTGLASFSLEHVMTDRVRVSVELLRGEPIVGRLLRFEASIAGHELFLLDGDGAVHVIPYHAVVRVSSSADDVKAARTADPR